MNIAGGRRISLLDLCARIASLCGRPDLAPRHEAQRPGDVRHSLADVALAEELIGARTVVDLDEGLTRTVAWYKGA